MKAQKRQNLIRNYKNFFAQPKEFLSDICTRFHILINNLERVDVYNGNTEIYHKFCDIIPDSFSEVITSFTVYDKMDEYDLPELYGLLLNFEESKEKKKLNTRRIEKYLK